MPYRFLGVAFNNKNLTQYQRDGHKLSLGAYYSEEEAAKVIDEALIHEVILWCYIM